LIDAIPGDAGYFKAETAADDELARLRLVEGYIDPQTFRCFDKIGVDEGWRCLEVGAGAGSVASRCVYAISPTFCAACPTPCDRAAGW
jgi:hypothetical protein